VNNLMKTFQIEHPNEMKKMVVTDKKKEVTPH